MLEFEMIGHGYRYTVKLKNSMSRRPVPPFPNYMLSQGARGHVYGKPQHDEPISQKLELDLGPGHVYIAVACANDSRTSKDSLKSNQLDAASAPASVVPLAAVSPKPYHEPHVVEEQSFATCVHTNDRETQSPRV